MRLPSKVTTFKESTLALFPLLLKEVMVEDVPPLALFEKVKGEDDDISNFVEALDCLFALGKIELHEQTGNLS
jgi:hypothetical protein